MTRWRGSSGRSPGSRTARRSMTRRCWRSSASGREAGPAGSARTCKANGVRVLVVEDEAKLASLLRQGLRQRGMGVDVAGTGEEAVRRATTTEYDVILLDVMLPGYDGFEVCRRLRDHEVWSPTLMLTALDDVEDRVRGLASGADDYLATPFSCVEMLARI